MQSKARLGIHVGYQPANNTYMVWVPEDKSNVLKGRLYESKDVTFDETWRYRSREEPAAPVGEEESSGAESEEEQAPATAEQDVDSKQGAVKEGAGNAHLQGDAGEVMLSGASPSCDGRRCRPKVFCGRLSGDDQVRRVRVTGELRKADVDIIVPASPDKHSPTP
jgi:hypothetical protein